MRVLILSKYIYEECLPEFNKNKTGFGSMVKATAESITQYDDVGVLTRVITQGGKLDKYTLIKHTWSDVLKSITIKSLCQSIVEAIGHEDSIKNKLKFLYFNLDIGLTKKIIKEFKPQIIHIHGIGESSKIYIDICDEMHIPYIVTLHGLIGLDSSILAPKINVDFEKDFLQLSEKRNIPVSVISSGMKQRIITNYGLQKGDNINIITNGTNTELDGKVYSKIRETYNIPDENEIIICLGNITKRKNQIQVVEAISRLKEDTRSKLTILFVGNDELNGTLQKRIYDLGLKDNFIICGFIENKEIPSYFNESKLNIVASLDEGFGLSMIEGFVYGVPTITFNDLDAIEDLYNDKAMILVHERSTEALSEGIESALKKNWDKKYIQKYSELFSLKKMSRKYHDLYENIVESWEMRE
nr:glycosyltransferase family 4 protein [uncultured Trichococcus sp.]